MDDLSMPRRVRPGAERVAREITPAMEAGMRGRATIGVHSLLSVAARTTGTSLPTECRRKEVAVPTYRINHATIALVLEKDHNEKDRHVAHTVPAGAIITIENDKTFDGDRLMEVVWGGITVLMFTQDLRSRTTPVHNGK